MSEVTNNIVPTSFKLDHSSICFLCLRNTEFDLNGSFPSALDTGPTKQSYSIRNITRFLEINVGEILRVRETQRQPDQLFKEDETDVKVSICEDCSLMTERFSNLYQTLELTKLRISQCLERIYDLMLAAENDSNRVDVPPANRSLAAAAANGKEIFSETCNYEEILMNMKALRRATIDKCTRRLKKLPDNDNVVQVPEETFNGVNVNMEVEVSDSFLASSTIGDIKTDDLSNVKTEKVKDSNDNTRSSKYCKAVKMETRELQNPIPMSSQNDMKNMDFDHLETTPNPQISEPPSSVDVIDLASDSGSLLEEPLNSSANTDFASVDIDHLNTTPADPLALASVEMSDLSSDSGSLIEPLNSIANSDFENGQGDREEVPSSPRRGRGHRCKYCKAGGTFNQKYVLELHMISYHCETPFQAEKNVRCSTNQLRIIIYHLLFKDLNIFYERKLKVFSCLHCNQKFNLHNNKNTTTLKLHLFKYHHRLLAGKLLEIQEDPDLNAKLEAACWDKGTCEYCETYHPCRITLNIHQRRYCPAVNNLWKVKVDSQRRQGRNKYTTCEKCGKVMTKTSLAAHRKYVCKRIKRQPKRKKVNCVKGTVSEQVAIHNNLAVTSAKNIENVGGGCQCHVKSFRCEYCRDGNCFHTGYILEQHMFSYHCEIFFPTVKHFHCSENQFRIIIYHLLFKDLTNFFEIKLDVFSCLHCKKKFSGPTIVPTYLKLHLLKYHNEQVARKLLEILQAPDVIAKLEAVCLARGTCKYCDMYHPTNQTLDLHETRYCPAVDNSKGSRKANVNCQQRQGRNKNTACEKCGKVMKTSRFFRKRDKGIKTKTKLEKIKGVLPGKTSAKTETRVDHQRRLRKRITCNKCGISMTKTSIFCHKWYCEGNKTQEKVAIDNDLTVANSSTSSSSSKPLLLPPNTMVKCSSCGKFQLLSDFAKQKRCSCSGVSLDISNFSSVSSSSTLPMSSDVPNSETIDMSSATL